MKKHSGFTLIEIIIFIIVTSILASTILIGFSAVLNKTPTIQQQIVASQTAKQCMEWFIGQRRTNGFSALSCPSTPSPSLCTAPTGYTISNSITCVGDANYKTITVTVSGLGDAAYTSMIVNY